MALAEPTNHHPIPVDRFGVRLAIIRAELGLNADRAAKLCGLSPSSWRNWERGTTEPQHYEAVCRKIADGTSFDLQWIKAGGSLRSRCFAVPAYLGQLELALDTTPRELALVGS